MVIEDLISAVSPDAPCGEDLLASDDPDFIDYYFNVEDRLPTSYFNMARGTLFDPKSVDLKAEIAQIGALLKRSRDLRLLGLEAKFNILAGRFKGFAEAVLGFVALLETYPADVHPTDPVDRRNAIEELDTLATIVAPLDYATLITDKRYGDVMFRPFGAATGKVEKREGEEPGDSNGITAALASSENIKTVDALHEQLTALREGIKKIISVCQSQPEGFTPRLDRLTGKLTDIHDMVLGARSDLAGGGPESESAAEGDDAGDAEGAAPAAGAAPATITITATATEVKDHRAAYRLLQGVEAYFATTEPASLALILVTQSRLLIGRPLVDALDALVAKNANYAEITFGSESNFMIPMNKMRELSNVAGIPPEDYSKPVEGEGPIPEILSRDHAGLALKSIEEFFRVREPASPIPILLFKARNMLTKDFHALVRELITP